MKIERKVGKYGINENGSMALGTNIKEEKEAREAEKAMEEVC